MNALITNATALAASSPVAGTTKDVLDDLVCLAFNILADGRMNAASATFGMLHCAPEHTVKLAKYEIDPIAWKRLQVLFMDYLVAVKTAAPFEDLLGSPYDEHLGQKLGQFLTPATVATAAASIPMHTDWTRPVRVLDACCGAGALLLGALRDTLARHGREGVARLALVANDLDAQMCRMTAVQVCFGAMVHGLPVHSLHIQNLHATTHADLMGSRSGLVLHASAQGVAA